MRRACVLLFVVASGALALGCQDPIHDGGVSQLGKDSHALGNNEFHWAGKPCLVCHDGTGPASTTFSVAGTVFSQAATFVGINGVDVDMTDSNGSVHTVTTDCVGNFFVLPSDWTPHFPILARITKLGVTQTMISPIGREGSCGHCHATQVQDPFSQVTHVYLGADDTSPPSTCGADPDLTHPP
jgi:hypothetical protein